MQSWRVCRNWKRVRRDEARLTGRKHPLLQILTLAELFQGKRPDIPWVDASVLKSAKREEQGKQGTLL
jgi:site-specific DNA-methyltransferase (adenine-specific)